MDYNNFLIKKLESEPVFKHNERDFSMFFLSAFGDAHAKANEGFANNALKMALMTLRYPISSYYRLEHDNEILIENIVKNIRGNPEVKNTIFKSYAESGEKLLKIYSDIQNKEKFDAGFIEELARNLNKILLGQIYILHRADSFTKAFGILPGVADEIYALRKKYEPVFGGFEGHFATFCKKILPKIKDAEIQDLRLLTPGELIQSIAGGKLPKNTVEARKSLVIVSYLPYLKIITGNDAQKIYSAVKVNEEKYNPVQNYAKEVVGKTVFGAGTITGPCTVITDYDRVETLGEETILITPSTLPKYNHIYKKAKAIITNEGGILAHAAILCRECSIPGIVGTKIATQIFKNGDIVEINFKKGIVRKVVKNL